MKKITRNRWTCRTGWGGLLLCASLAQVAIQAAAQPAPQVLNAEEARHFLVRTGFAPTQAQVDALAGKNTLQVIGITVDNAQAAKPQHPAPAFVAKPLPAPILSLATQEERMNARQLQLREGLDIKTWWLREMVESDAPLQERLTLFWHNHFATSQQKVVRSVAMWNQHQLLRSQALGSFATLLHAIAKDPAMLAYLDGANSRKEAPNENFAREVMELFVLGEASQAAQGLGGYTEQDIREAARAFTGWSVERDTFAFRFRPVFHDTGDKTVLGTTGRLDGDAVLDILLKQDAAARFVVRKLWLEFVSPTPVDAEVERLAQAFKSSGYQLAPLMKGLLASDAFWAPENRAALVKSPVELLVGSVRQLNLPVADTLPLVLKSTQLGQNLLAPPNVKGWPGYTHWITASALLERKCYSQSLLQAPAQGMVRTMAAGMGEPAMQASGRVNGQEMAITNLSSPASLSSPPSPLGKAQQDFLGVNNVRRLAAAAQIRWDAPAWLQAQGLRPDSEPDKTQQQQLALLLLGRPGVQPVADGTVGMGWLKALMADPAYQLK